MIEKKHRGFAAMTPELRRELARRGGIAAQRSGRAHRFETGSTEAVMAGRKGGRGRAPASTELSDPEVFTPKTAETPLSSPEEPESGKEKTEE
jgi:general stress protein YciG